MRNVETSYLCPERVDGQVNRPDEPGSSIRHTIGGAGLRCWKKRMPACNGADTGLCPARKGADVPDKPGSIDRRVSL